MKFGENIFPKLIEPRTTVRNKLNQNKMRSLNIYDGFYLFMWFQIVWMCVIDMLNALSSIGFLLPRKKQEKRERKSTSTSARERERERDGENRHQAAENDSVNYNVDGNRQWQRIKLNKATFQGLSSYVEGVLVHFINKARILHTSIWTAQSKIKWVFACVLVRVSKQFEKISVNYWHGTLGERCLISACVYLPIHLLVWCESSYDSSISSHRHHHERRYCRRHHSGSSIRSNIMISSEW